MRLGNLSSVLSCLIAVCGAVVLVRAAGENDYAVSILASHDAGDGQLVNAWGIAASATSPWWVANNGTGTSTIYTGAGVKAGLIVNVPGAPTGIVAYSGSEFLISPGKPARFMFASEDGTISAWNPTLVPNTQAVVKFGDPASGSIYKGLAILDNTLYTTDFAECSVEAINGTFHEFDTAGGFADDSIPEHYCPFGIQAIDGSIFVTYALRGGLDDIAGVSHGFVREFDAQGHLVRKVASHGTLNSPWGLAMAPASFGKFGGCLLVGNFGDGLINAYCEDVRGEFRPRGRLQQDGGEIRIDGLWGIGFGNNAGSGSADVLYFAAGPDDESGGTFGKIESILVPRPR
jgi:uncharacterized protein (TIGR03118 family)